MHHFYTQVMQAYDSIAQTYDRNYKDGFSIAENQVIQTYLRAYQLNQGMILDLGCGTGLLLELIPKRPGEYIGLDISQEMIKVGRAKFPKHKFIRGTMENIPYPDGSFDRVICLFGGISYIAINRVPIVVREIFRVLRTGGRFFIMAYGKEHRAKKGQYIFNGNGYIRHCFSRKELSMAFHGLFPVSKIFGMNAAVEAYRQTSLSIKALVALIHTDINIVGHELPDLCQYQIVLGEKIIGETVPRH